MDECPICLSELDNSVYETKCCKKKFHVNCYNECIKIKKEDSLRNVPAGNIDEMCFSAFYNGIDLKNNSSQGINLLTPKHDKWY